MLDNLLVACDMWTDKFLVPLCLAVARLAYMRGIGVSEGVCLSMEYFFQGGLWPGQIWVVICVNVAPNPIFFGHRQVVL
jgi:hypothetical protein